jgi:hypothetical protein
MFMMWWSKRSVRSVQRSVILTVVINQPLKVVVKLKSQVRDNCSRKLALLKMIPTRRQLPLSLLTSRQ